MWSNEYRTMKIDSVDGAIRSYAKTMMKVDSVVGVMTE
jgi:hypothetical protein